MGLRNRLLQENFKKLQVFDRAQKYQPSDRVSYAIAIARSDKKPSGTPMPIAEYSMLLVLLLAGLVSALNQMGSALESDDMDGFMVWTGVATFIAFLPSAF